MFGVENEIHCHNYVSSNKTQNLTSEKKGMITGIELVQGDVFFPPTPYRSPRGRGGGVEERGICRLFSPTGTQVGYFVGSHPKKSP